MVDLADERGTAVMLLFRRPQIFSQATVESKTVEEPVLTAKPSSTRVYTLL